MPHKVTRHACDHCGKAYASITAAKKHEEQCFYSESARACATCGHLKAEYWDHHWLEDGQDQCNWGYMAACEIQKDRVNGDDRHLQHGCPFWQKRTVKGTFKFGKTYIEKPTA